ncbi:TPA: response regulator transcription factor [Stenotrophomonas maltophilia]
MTLSNSVYSVSSLYGVRRVLLVEADTESAGILEAQLRKEGFLVAVADDGEHALDLFAHWRPHIVLLETTSSRMAAADLLAMIRGRASTPVIMISAIDDERDRLGALHCGADDYIVKPYSPREVVARVHVVLRRVSLGWEGDSVLQQGRLIADGVAVRVLVESEASGPPAVVDLTPAEFNIVYALLRTPSKAFTRGELLQGGATVDSSSRVVDTHVHNIRRKLEHHGITGVLVTVRGVGYRFK